MRCAERPLAPARQLRLRHPGTLQDAEQRGSGGHRNPKPSLSGLDAAMARFLKASPLKRLVARPGYLRTATHQYSPYTSTSPLAPVYRQAKDRPACSKLDLAGQSFEGIVLGLPSGGRWSRRGPCRRFGRGLRKADQEVILHSPHILGEDEL